MFGAELFACLLLLAIGLVLLRLFRVGPFRLAAGLEANDPARPRFAVSGWSAQELACIVRDFSRLCRGQLRDGFHVELRSRPGGVFHLEAPADLEPGLFCLLLNALNCPSDPELQGREVAVLGSVVLTPAFTALPPALERQPAWIYLPATDCDCDIVQVQLRSSAVYRHAIVAGWWEAAQESSMPDSVRALCGTLE